MAGLPSHKRDLLATLSAIPAPPAEELAGSKWPVTIVGAGPAGTAAAIVLRRRDYPVLLLDRYAPPREKVCGDGLVADSYAALDALGLLARVQAIGYATRAGRIVSPSHFETTITADFTTLERHFLDGLMLRHSIDQGATFRLARVERAEPRENSTIALHIAGGAKPIATEHLIIASGATAARWWTTSPAAASAVAARCYIYSKVSRAEMVVSFSKYVPNGYGWIFPLGEGRYNIGVIRFRTARATPKSLNTVFRDFVEREPIAREIFSASTPLTRLKGAPLQCGLDLHAATPHPGMVAAGESAATTFPFTGEGIGKAMQSGILAAEQVIAALESRNTAPLAAYRARLETELRPSYEGYVRAERWLSRPWMYDLLVNRVQKSPYLRSVATGLISGSSSPAQLFSAQGLVKSFWQ
jgi:flavin-dependent dehydrogenase